MGDRFPGGVISKTPPTVTGPATSGPLAGEGGSASGVWTLEEQLGLQKAGIWPQKVLPRELYAWGRNSIGQVGDGTNASRSSPVQIGNLTNWIKVSAGLYHTASTKTDGTLWTWGSNSVGRLGDGTSVNRSSPVQVGALTNWSQVSAGGNHTACVKTDGTLWTWGAGSNGQLGNSLAGLTYSPIQVGALTNWAQVSAGSSRTACVTTAGTLFTWGRNSYGYLGQNNTIDRSSPVQVGALTNWAQVSLGYATACVTTAGTLFTWGRNNSGQLGQNNTINLSSPVQVGALTDWSYVSSGSGNCMALKTDGTLWVWGSNRFGQLGNGAAGFGINKSSPVQIGVLTNWAQVSVGDSHCAAVKTDSTLWTWGRNKTNYDVFGSLGDGTTLNRSSPVQIGALTNWVQVAAGGYQTAAINKG
jgi:alpha-tubulin suppressor-like RCC1 family protein